MGNNFINNDNSYVKRIEPKELIRKRYTAVMCAINSVYDDRTYELLVSLYFDSLISKNSIYVNVSANDMCKIYLEEFYKIILRNGELPCTKEAFIIQNMIKAVFDFKPEIKIIENAKIDFISDLVDFQMSLI